MIRHWKRKQLRADREPVPHEVPDSEEDLQRSNGVYPKYLHILGSVELLQDSGSLRSTEVNMNQIWRRLQQLEEKARQADSSAKGYLAAVSQADRDAQVHRENLTALLKSIGGYLQKTLPLPSPASVTTDSPLPLVPSRARRMTAPAPGLGVDLTRLSRPFSDPGLHRDVPRSHKADLGDKRVRADSPFDEVYEARIVTS